VILASCAAQLVAKLKHARWFVAFGQFAAAAAIGLLGVTLFALARPLADVHWALLLGAVVVFAASLRGVHPLFLIAGATLLGCSLDVSRLAASEFVESEAQDIVARHWRCFGVTIDWKIGSPRCPE
jgi:chromate transport protein ChrA